MAESKILYGGQAVIEGVMMRGRNFVSCAVRRQDGTIELTSQPIPKNVYSGVWSKAPFLRAMPLLWDTLVLGTQMLTWSANVHAVDEMRKEKEKEREKEGLREGVQGQAETRNEKREIGVLEGDTETGKQGDTGKTGTRNEKREAGGATPERKMEEGLSQGAIYGTLALSLGLGIAIFFALPVLVANFLGNFGVTPFWNNIIEGVIRLGLFLIYLLAIGRIPEIQRVFMYHGAEHKTIAAYEGGAELVPAQIQPFSKEHPRCGTGFLLTVVVISILFFIALGDLPLGLRLLSRILLIPVVAAVSYELIRFSARHRNIFIFDWLIVRPSLALQSLTTRQPTDDMVEVAVASFQDVRRQEEQLAAA